MATLYLVRHAQSHPSPDIPQPKWPLSAVGKNQTLALAKVLRGLKVDSIYSSPFNRCLQTIAPFSKTCGKKILIEDDLRERLVTKAFLSDFDSIWRKSWDDFHFALPGCESSKKCQKRVVNILSNLSNRHLDEKIIISFHGNTMGLFMNFIDSSFHREATEAIRNPDLFKVEYDKGRFSWDKNFALTQHLSPFATHYSQTPVGKESEKIWFQQHSS